MPEVISVTPAEYAALGSLLQHEWELSEQRRIQERDRETNEVLRGK